MAKRQMVINYVPGEECRVAVIEDGKLEEFHSERADAASHVGSIYLGTVVNVEPAIQAAFVDFGLEQSGFLHVSDLHPRYFPGEDAETTEMVGKKTPRRERPPIQQCLRRGQEIAVQVLKEGVGTKGPTLTSYLSIPGRFLVMMPLMDKVGVSRKVEDEETRRKMREILDQLDLPEGFGFILRTAGLERTKAELKRDLAYLQRLWKDIEKRWKKGSRPRLLYSESDLLVRALRDMLTSDIDRIIIDNEAALARAARFLKIVAPRSAANLVRYTGKTPLFHAMGIEPQIRNIHAREVPLPSGGRLVIDETEALVAIDVNSGKSREARDAETNAYETNLEAAEEICRQLRLRDLGGIVVNDLIDMRSAKHRRDVEAKFKELLKKDRARSTVAPISPFGILEMTRQRMRGSQESMHFASCPTCRGRGLVQKPDSVADDAIRELATLLEYNRVARVEMVVAPRLAGELLSSKRHTLSRLERLSGKKVEVRVSEAVPVDRVSFYAYDDRGADIDVSRLPAPKLDESLLAPFELPGAAAEDWAVDPEREAAEARAAEPLPEPEPEPEMLGDSFDEPAPDIEDEQRESGGGKKKRRRRRRRGKGEHAAAAENGKAEGGKPERGGEERRREKREEQRAQKQAASEAASAPEGAETEAQHAAGENGQATETGGKRRRRRRRRGRGGRGEGQAGAAPAHGGENGAEAAEGEQPAGTVLRRVGGARKEAEEPAHEEAPERDEATARREEAVERLMEPVEHSEPERVNGTRASLEERDEEEGATAFEGAPSGPDGEADEESTGQGEGGEGAEGGEGRRRRRRRRRRGRGGGEGGSQPQQQQQEPQQPRQERSGSGEDRGGERREGRGRGDRRGGRDRGGRGQGGGGGGAGEAKAAPAPQPQQAPAPAAAAKPQPRTLYAFRRKLTASERARIKPE